MSKLFSTHPRSNKEAVETLRDRRFIAARPLQFSFLELKSAEDVEQIFHIVRSQWLQSGMTGKELYDFAYKTAADLGWVLNMELTGHRLSEFPHTAYYDGTLAAVSIRPSPNLWVLEVQVRHATKPIGGFFEDLLLEDKDYI